MIALDEAQLRLASSALPARQQQPKASIFLLELIVAAVGFSISKLQ
jgi:hypothetical protein